MILEIKGKTPQIDETAWIAPNATLIGDVTVAKDCSVWYSAVIRGDEDSIVIGERSNIQDNATIHCDPGMPVIIGEDVTIGHNAIVHSCRIGKGTVIGMGAVILNQAEIGEGCMIAAGAVVTGKTVIPPNSMAAGAPAVVKRQHGEETVQKNVANAREYMALAAKYKESGR